MSSKTINISLPAELVKKIDKAAKSEYASRSDFIRSTMFEKIQVLEGDNEDWKTIVDFTKINPQGVPAEEVIKAIDELLAS